MDDPVKLELSLLDQILSGWLELLDELDLETLAAQACGHTVRTKVLACRSMVRSASGDQDASPSF